MFVQTSELHKSYILYNINHTYSIRIISVSFINNLDITITTNLNFSEHIEC